jgi:hypothetical protein
MMERSAFAILANLTEIWYSSRPRLTKYWERTGAKTLISLEQFSQRTLRLGCVLFRARFLSTVVNSQDQPISMVPVFPQMLVMKKLYSMMMPLSAA